MSSRSTRRSQPSLSSIEALLLAQATWEFGAAPTNWSLIAKILSKHPLLSRPKSFFTAQSCYAMYEHLLKEAGLESSEANYIPHAETNLNLAQKYYRSRFEELKGLIVAEEIKFKAILKEIEDIRAGLLDTKIQSRTGESRIEKPASSETGATSLPMLHTTSRGMNQDNLVSVYTDYPSSPLKHPVENENHLFSLDGRNQKPTKGNITFRSNTGETPGKDADLEPPPVTRRDDGYTDQRQEEEEEEELEVEEEEKKEEEEETSQGQGELEVDHGDAPASPKSVVFGIETESDQPLDAIMGEKHISDVDVVRARRSTRRRKSSMVSTISHSLVRTRLRARGRADESQTVESDVDEFKDNVSTVDDERTSSPFDPGTTRRRDGKRKASLVDSVDSPQDRKRSREDSEPVEEEEPGPSIHNTRARAARNTSRTEEQLALKRFQSVIGMLHSQISQHRNGTIFHHPIKPSEAPDYHDVVKRPMDLKTIKTRVRDGMISNSLEFQRDIYLMFANAMMYNRPGSNVYTMAEDMMLESEAQINTFRQTEGLLSVKRGQR